MNLNFNEKQIKNRRIISIILCFLLIFAFIGSTNVDSYAVAPGVAVSGEAVLSGLMSAYGGSNLTANEVTSTWNSLTIEQQAALIEAGKRAKTTGNMGFAEITIVDPDYLSMAQFHVLEQQMADELSEGILSQTSIDNTYQKWNGYFDSPVLTSEFPYQCIYSTSSEATLFFSKVELYYNSSTKKLYSIDGSNSISKYYYNKSTGTEWKLLSAPSSVYTLSYPILQSNTNIYTNATKSNIYFEKNTGDYTTSRRPVENSLYLPQNSPLVATNDGAIKVTVPYTDNPDTNVEVPPDNSISNPITLDTVLQGYGSIDNFFEQGGTITLADGTVIGNVHEASRANGNQWSDVNVSDNSEPWAYQIPILGEILKWLKKIAAAIGAGIATIIDAISDTFHWEREPKGPSTGNGIGSFFDPILALLIAIMHLIAKVIAFIGQLYSIPASSSMLHPTMIQGLNWARGFETAGGVNLYGLITGVISVVFGIVCFKLLRRMITGIGTLPSSEDSKFNPYKGE